MLDYMEGSRQLVDLMGQIPNLQSRLKRRRSLESQIRLLIDNEDKSNPLENEAIEYILAKL